MAPPRAWGQAQNGGPLDQEDCFDEFWTSPEVKAVVLQKLRYIVARWGYSRSFAMLELFNENPVIEAVGPITKWHAEIGAAWHRMNSLAGYDHLLSTSRYPFKGSAYVDPKGSSPLMPTIDVAQAHAYPKIDQPLGDGAGPLAEFFLNNTVGAARLVHTPFVWGEVGIDHSLRNGSSGADIAYDPTGASLHLPMWATAFGQGSGALFWYSSGFVSPRNLWYHYRGFRRFVDRVPWASATLRPVPAHQLHAPQGVGLAALADGPRLWLWARNLAYEAAWMLRHQGMEVPAVAAGKTAVVPCGAGELATAELALRWFSTTSGDPLGAPQTLQCSGGGLHIHLPALATDLAATISPAATAIKSDDAGASQYCPLAPKCGAGALEDCGPAFGNSTPQFHMRDRSCPSADPNGPFYCERHQKYHLFYQSPKGRPCQPPTQPCDQFTEVWGHAVSDDLCKWTHLPAAIWPDERYDMSGAWTGSATVVGGVPHLMFPGLNVVDHLPETMNIATPANLSDPYYEKWKMSPRNPIVQAGHDFTTAWRTAAGEWRVTNVDGAVFCSSDFKSWTRAPSVGGASVFPGGECPDLYALPPPCAGCTGTVDTATGPTHVFKRSNQQSDRYQFGRYADGQRNSSGSWQNSSDFLPVDFSFDDHNQSHVYLLRQIFLWILSPSRSTDMFCGAGTHRRLSTTHELGGASSSAGCDHLRA